jgi:hypothetical protein
VVTSLGLKNVITVQNAINIGLGFSYDLSGIVKWHQCKIVKLWVQNWRACSGLHENSGAGDGRHNLAVKQDIVYDEAVEQAPKITE